MVTADKTPPSADETAEYAERLLAALTRFLGNEDSARTVRETTLEQARVGNALRGVSEEVQHFDIKYHWLREKVKANQVKLTYINTHEQLADIFTKPLGAMQHHYLRGKLTGYR